MLISVLTVRLAGIRGVEKAQEESAPAPQAEASEEAAPAAADEANGPTPEEEAEAEAKVSVRRAAGQLLTLAIWTSWADVVFVIGTLA